jgi:hypothetical protein
VTCFVFLGPTLSMAEAATVLDAVYLPPVRQGDVLRLVRANRPRAIGIVDGYFRAVPACWHKEVLFALGEGVHVFGAASMGALRAAELDRFGMVGVGRIYGAYRSGVFPPFDREPFEDDDEVAIVHGPAETGYVAASDAMVDIRATLARAADAGVVGVRVRDTLAALAKALPYPDRGYPRLLATARAQGLDETILLPLEAWLPHHRFDLKWTDALEMLGAMREFLARDPAPFAADFRLEASAAWRAALSAVDRPSADGGAALDELVLDEVRLGAGVADGLRRRAVERLAALEAAVHRHAAVDGAARRSAATAIRAARGLVRQRDVDRWLGELDLDRDGLDRLAADEARLDFLTALDAHAAGACLLDLLRLEGLYPELRARAVAKRDALAGLAERVLDEAAVRELVSWHALLGERPAPVDPDSYARSLGFADAADLARAIWRERAWRRHGAGTGARADSAGGEPPNR